RFLAEVVDGFVEILARKVEDDLLIQGLADRRGARRGVLGVPLGRGSAEAARQRHADQARGPANEYEVHRLDSLALRSARRTIWYPTAGPGKVCGVYARPGKRAR